MSNLNSKALFKRILQGLDSVSLSLTLILVFIVAFNVVARIFHDLTAGSISLMIPGAIELSRYTLLFIIFTALPRASISGMVRVDLISMRLPIKLADVLDRLWLLMMSIFSAILVWLFSQKAMLTFSRGDATQDLQVPLFAIYMVISLASAVTALSCLIKVFDRSDNALFINKESS